MLRKIIVIRQQIQFTAAMAMKPDNKQIGDGTIILVFTASTKPGSPFLSFTFTPTVHRHSVRSIYVDSSSPATPPCPYCKARASEAEEPAPEKEEESRLQRQ